MAPVRKHVGRDKFSSLFGALKTQQYLDPGFRAAPTVTYVIQPVLLKQKLTTSGTKRYHGMLLEAL